MKKSWLSPIVIFSLVLIAYIYFYFAVTQSLWPVLNFDMQAKGQFGDSFGVLTSLFSALAFGGVLFTLWYQHQTLQENKKNTDIRHFESILFNLISAYNAIVDDMDIHGSETRTLYAKGRDCFYRYWVRHLKPTYKRIKNGRPNDDELLLARDSYEILWLRHRHNLSHYFRFIYNIF